MANPFQGTSKKARSRARKRQGQQMLIPVPYLPQQPIVQQKKKKNPRRRQQSQRGRHGAAPLSRLERNDYLFSLQNPKEGYGARIPDLSTLPTSVFQMTSDVTLTTGASGDAVVSFDLGYIGNYYAATNPSSGTITYAAVQGLAGRSTVIANFELFRPVSASLEVFYMGNSATDGGLMIAGWVPRTILPNSIVTASALLSMPFTDSYPVRNGVKILYRPMDDIDFEYQTPGLVNFPSLIVWINGAATTSFFKIRIVANYEAIPTSDILSFMAVETSTPSVDQIQRAVRWAANISDKITPMFNTLASDQTYQNSFQGMNSGLSGGKKTITYSASDSNGRGGIFGY